MPSDEPPTNETIDVTSDKPTTSLGASATPAEPHDVAGCIPTAEEAGAPRAPAPPPPTAPAATIPEVTATAGENDIEARVDAMSPDERFRVLHGVLAEVGRWYLLVERKVRPGRVWKTVVEVEFDPRSRFSQNPIQARWAVDVALAIIAALGIDAGSINDPPPPSGNWEWRLQECAMLLRGPNLIPLPDRLRAERAASRVKAAERRAIRQRCQAIADDFFAGRLAD